jgi:type I protein arginine methyltransferase
MALPLIPNFFMKWPNTWPFAGRTPNGRGATVPWDLETHFSARRSRRIPTNNPRLWKTLDYATLEIPDVSGEISWTVNRTGVGHGIIVWFDADLAEGVSFSNSPGSPETIYGSLFLPWIHQVQLVPGDTVRVQLEARLSGDDYVWRWNTQVVGIDAPNAIRDQFEQSTLAGAVLSPKKLQKIASTFVPRLSEEGLLDRKILEMMDGRATLEQIAKHLAAENPQRFARRQDALTTAAALSRKYSL